MGVKCQLPPQLVETARIEGSNLNIEEVETALNGLIEVLRNASSCRGAYKGFISNPDGRRLYATPCSQPEIAVYQRYGSVTIVVPSQLPPEIAPGL